MEAEAQANYKELQGDVLPGFRRWRDPVFHQHFLFGTITVREQAKHALGQLIEQVTTSRTLCGEKAHARCCHEHWADLARTLSPRQASRRLRVRKACKDGLAARSEGMVFWELHANGGGVPRRASTSRWTSGGRARRPSETGLNSFAEAPRNEFHSDQSGAPLPDGRERSGLRIDSPSPASATPPRPHESLDRATASTVVLIGIGSQSHRSIISNGRTPCASTDLNEEVAANDSYSVWLRLRGTWQHSGK